MSESKALQHVNAPHNQPFNVGARPNKTKKNSWWNIHSATYWRNRDKNKKSKVQDAE